MANGVLIAALDFSKAAEEVFNRWHDPEHLPERQRIAGFLRCERWIGDDNPLPSVATYDLDSLRVLEGAAYRAIGGDNLSGWSRRITAKCRRLARFKGEQTLPGDEPPHLRTPAGCWWSG